jgi:cation:H+ antiporter
MIIKSADILIDSSTKIAQRFGISSFIIGITVIAFGTSAPELAVGIVSALNQANQLTLGNIIGSSLSNIALIVGLSAIILPLQVKDAVLKRELPILLITQIILGGMLFIDGRLSRIDGLTLLGMFVLFITYIAVNARKSRRMRMVSDVYAVAGDERSVLVEEQVFDQSGFSLLKLGFASSLSLLGLFMGGKWTVDSSTLIAQSFGLSETLIGLTVVALATTMPELITSIVAARKKQHEIVLGNCIGSSIFNIMLVLGVSSTITPISVERGLWFDFVYMLMLTVIVAGMSYAQKRIKRPGGIVLLVAYIFYLVLKVISVLT